MSETLKNERISETTNAANDSGAIKTDSKSEEKKEITTVVEPKNKMIRQISYPVVIGSIGAFIGVGIAKNMNKDKKNFVIGGVIIGAGLGYTLYKYWENKNFK